MRKRKKAKKSIPRFESEDQEREFWARHGVVDYFDWDKGGQGVVSRAQTEHDDDLSASTGVPAGRAEGLGQ